LRRRPAALGRKRQRGERRLPILIHEHANCRQYRELGRRFGSAQAGSVMGRLGVRWEVADSREKDARR
jgi:hypothetical protein